MYYPNLSPYWSLRKINQFIIWYMNYAKTLSHQVD